MVTFIDDARAYRSQGASRRQLIDYIKLHGVDEARAQRLADKLELELGIIDEPLPAPPTQPTTPSESVIDLRDEPRSLPLVAATDPARAVSRLQSLIDTGVPRGEIRDFLERSGVPSVEAAYLVKNTPPTDPALFVPPRPPRRALPIAHVSAIVATVIGMAAGIAMLIYGLYRLNQVEGFRWEDGWFWVATAGAAITLLGAWQLIGSAD